MLRDTMAKLSTIPPMLMSNVDPAEIEKFSKLASHWWDEKGPLKTLHHINSARLQFTQDGNSLKGKRVLDVGCGGGIFSEALANAGAIVTAIDLSRDAINVAKAHASESELDIDYRCIDLNKLEEPPFDLVTCYELLEHVPNPSQFVRDLARHVKAQGQLFLSTINRTPKAYAYTIIGAEYILGLLPKQTHDYKKFIRPSELQRMSERAGFSVDALKGLDYQPFTKAATLTGDVSVNYLMRCVKED